MSDNINNDDRGKRGEKGGEVAANKSVSAASVAKLLGGIDYPANKKDIIRHAQQKGGEIDDANSVINTLNRIRDRDYNSMADIEHEFGQVNG